MKKKQVYAKKYFLGLKLDLKMKLSILFALVASINIQANSYAQKTKLTLQMMNSSTEEVLEAIEGKTDFRFIYKLEDVDLKHVVSINVENQPIDVVLKQLFANLPVKFKLRNTQVILKKNRSVKKMLSTINTDEKAVLQFTVSGTVTDENGQPLPGASVLEKGTTNGVQTDFDGMYSLELVGEESVLVVSYLGFTTKELKVGDQNEVNIKMIPDSAALDEVVVTGYGTQKRSDITGAISEIKVSDKTPTAYAGVDQLIAGRASGIQVTSQSGDPGAPTNIKIRGTGTIGSNAPLWVVDGFPTVGNPSTSLNINDIESIQVLKGTSAAAIYGARASNGVVLVTTKRGRKGEFKMTYDGYIGRQTNIKNYDVLGVDDYINYQNDLGNDFSAFRGQNSVDWQDQVIDKLSTIKNHNLNISGGGEKTNYSTSLNYFSSESTTKGASFERFNFRVNSDTEIGSLFKVGESLQIVRSNTRSSRDNNGQIGRRTHAARNVPFFQPFGNGSFGYNPVNVSTVGVATATTSNWVAATDRRLGVSEPNTTEVLGNIYAQIEPLEGLTFRLNGGIDFRQNNSSSASKQIGNEFGERVGRNNNSRNTRSASTRLTTNMNAILEYKKTFGQHDFSLLGGYEETVNKQESVNVSGINPPFETLRVVNGSESITGSDGLPTPFVLRGWLGRLTYNFDDRYLLTVNVRNDESSRFAPGYRSQTFPSFSAGWNIANEKFFPKTDLITNLKLRGGWGQSGNQLTGAAASYIASLSIGGAVIFGENQEVVTTPVPVTIATLTTWEVANQTDFGLDATLFNGGLDLTFEYYNRLTDNILLNVNPAGAAGTVRDVLVNAGEVTNKGFEASLNYNFSAGDWYFSLGGNLTTVNNEVTALDQEDTVIIRSISDDFSETNITQVGSAVGAFYGWETDGVFQNDAEVAAHAQQSDNTAPGDVRFKDINGRDANGALTGKPDGIINGDDRKVLGSPIPDFYYGLNLTSAYKGFDFSAIFQGVGGIQLINGARYELERMATTANQLTTVLDRWTPQNPSTSTPRAVLGDPNNNDRFSNRWVESADYFRLKNIQIGYSFSEMALESIFRGHVKKFRIYGGVQNLLTFTKYSGLDPEATQGLGFGVGSSDEVLNTGQDDGRTPLPRTFQVGLQLTF